MLERFGFTGDRLTARIGDLSGGERRRFQLLRLLLSEPNVLLLDEPTNDLDIETLNVLEDFLDGWPGTLVVVSHDRYFLERVTDSTWALLDDGQISMLPRGVEEYLERRAAALAAASRTAVPGPAERRFRGPPRRIRYDVHPGQLREARKARRPAREAAGPGRRAGARTARRAGRARRRLREARRGRRTPARGGAESASRRSGWRPPSSSTEPSRFVSELVRGEDPLDRSRIGSRG